MRHYFLIRSRVRGDLYIRYTAASCLEESEGQVTCDWCGGLNGVCPPYTGTETRGFQLLALCEEV